jgi:hypothetical protein
VEFLSRPDADHLDRRDRVGDCAWANLQPGFSKRSPKEHDIVGKASVARRLGRNDDAIVSACRLHD